MSKKKVYVLTQQGRNNYDQDTLDVIGVYSTKTAANERFRQKMEEIRAYYASEFEGDSTSEDEVEHVSWSISVEDTPIYDELLITEKTLDND